jgi:hypothetical protein
MNIDERNQLIDMVAQAVIDKIEERHKINALAELVYQRVVALQKRESELLDKEKASVKEFATVHILRAVCSKEAA